MGKKLLLTLFVCQLALVAASAPLVAMAEDEGLICATIYPCNEDGTVMDEFNEGACAVHYREICALDRLAKLNEDLNSCQNELTSLDSKYGRSKRVMRRLRQVLKDSES